MTYSSIFGQAPNIPAQTVNKTTLNVSTEPMISKNILWSFPIVYSEMTNIKYYDENVYILGKDKLISLDSKNGKVKWSYSIINPKNEAIHAIRLNGPILYKNNIYFSDQNYNLIAIDNTSGKLIWKAPLESISLAHVTPEITTPVFNENKLYVGTAGQGMGRSGKVYCIDISTGKQLWQYNLDMAIQTPPLLIDKMLIVGGGSKRVALDSESGSLLWKWGTFKRSVGIHGSVAVQNGKLLFLTSNSISGQQGSGISGSSNQYSRPGQIFGFIECLDIKTGNELWEFDSGCPGELQLEQGMAITSDISSLFGITGTPHLVVVEINSGKELFKIDNPNQWPPALLKGRMYVSSDKTTKSENVSVLDVYALSKKQLIHTYCRPEPQSVPPLVAGNSLVLTFWNEGEKKSTIIGIDPENIKEQWRISINDRFSVTPQYGKEGILIFGNKSIHMLN